MTASATLSPGRCALGRPGRWRAACRKAPPRPPRGTPPPPPPPWPTAHRASTRSPCQSMASPPPLSPRRTQMPRLTPIFPRTSSAPAPRPTAAAPSTSATRQQHLPHGISPCFARGAPSAAPSCGSSRLFGESSSLTPRLQALKSSASHSIRLSSGIRCLRRLRSPRPPSAPGQQRLDELAGLARLDQQRRQVAGGQGLNDQRPRAKPPAAAAPSTAAKFTSPRPRRTATFLVMHVSP